jgi:recombinase
VISKRCLRRSPNTRRIRVVFPIGRRARLCGSRSRAQGAPRCFARACARLAALTARSANLRAQLSMARREPLDDARRRLLSNSLPRLRQATPFTSRDVEHTNRRPQAAVRFLLTIHSLVSDTRDNMSADSAIRSDCAPTLGQSARSVQLQNRHRHAVRPHACASIRQTAALSAAQPPQNEHANRHRRSTWAGVSWPNDDDIGVGAAGTSAARSREREQPGRRAMRRQFARLGPSTCATGGAQVLRGEPGASPVDDSLRNVGNEGRHLCPLLVRQSARRVHRRSGARLPRLRGTRSVVGRQRIPRQEDTAGLFKRLTFLGVRIVTLAEGEITHLHVGFKGTMNALFLKDVADKTCRGLRGRVEAGRSGGGLCYGYRVVRSVIGTTITTGEREIEPIEAAVVDRIFREFVGGASPKQIAKRLNQEGIKGPFGAQWNPSTIHGNAPRGTGILNNELYVGRLTWNRLPYIKNPDTGRRVSRLNARSEWIIKQCFRPLPASSASRSRQSSSRHGPTRTKPVVVISLDRLEEYHQPSVVQNGTDRHPSRRLASSDS